MESSIQDQKKEYFKQLPLKGDRLTFSQENLMEYIGVFAGLMCQIYGKIKNGKTYFATILAMEIANQGQVVYVNWPIDWQGYDERLMWKYRFLALLGLKKRFKVYPKSNLKFADLSDLNNVKIDGKATGLNFYDWFAKLTSCTCFFDEGHIYYDSYLATKMDMAKRLSILETAHFDRSVFIISQRASAIHAVLRGNVNVFYKIEKTYEGLFGVRFRRVEFQETGADEKPNEERIEMVNLETGEKSYGEYRYAESIKYFWGRQRFFKAYNSKYRRLGMKESQENNAEVYKVSWLQNLQNMFIRVK